MKTLETLKQVCLQYKNIHANLILLLGTLIQETENIDQPYDKRNIKHTHEFDKICWKKYSAEIVNIYNNNFVYLNI